MLRPRLLIALFAAAALAAPVLSQGKLPDLPRLMSPRSIMSLPAAKPDATIRYGEASVQAIELFLPKADPETPDALRPVVAIVHGGCYRAANPGAEQMRAAAAAFVERGFAVWSIGYRRVDEPGGGYPGTYQDVGRALDLIRDHAAEHRLDLGRVLFFGHSAGAHLALWAAGRGRLPATSPLVTENPLKPRGVVAVGGVGDIERFADQIDPNCGPGTLALLVGTAPAPETTPATEASEAAGATGATAATRASGTAGATDSPAVAVAGDAAGAGPALPRLRAQPFADTSPAALLPLGVPVVMLHGVYDPVTYPFVGLQFATIARRAGDRAEIQIAPNAGHFEVIAPGTPAFNQGLAAVATLLR